MAYWMNKMGKKIKIEIMQVILRFCRLSGVLPNKDNLSGSVYSVKMYINLFLSSLIATTSTLHLVRSITGEKYNIPCHSSKKKVLCNVYKAWDYYY